MENKIEFTITQKRRLLELGCRREEIDQSFESQSLRDEVYRKIEFELVRQGRESLSLLLREKKRTDAAITGKKLEDWLSEEGFAKVITPSIITKAQLEKMTIDQNHPLNDQVFWLDAKKCLRPMLAPNLYILMKELRRVTNEAVKIYEIGSCFRKESQGARHMNEFTMLNCVELAAVREGEQIKELYRLANRSMEILGIKDYELKEEESTVYGVTLDIEVDGIEVASGSFGPHFLDARWGVFDTWVGIGFGIERLTMVLNKSDTIKRFGPSISFIDGWPLNL